MFVRRLIDKLLRDLLVEQLLLGASGAQLPGLPVFRTLLEQVRP